jgi:L-alanine-DL-glutamate epimerase-like enolase superfamily enzyme
MRELSIARETWPIRGAFTISRGSRTEAHVLVASIRDGETVGRGECVPYARYGESMDSVAAQIEAMRPQLAAGLDREGLRRAMAPGAGRNAIDCALWDLEAKRAGKPAWQLAGLTGVAPVVTAFTLSIDTPAAMGEAARANASRPLLKVKLKGDAEDEARVAAIRTGAPHARLIIDANEAWTPEIYRRLIPVLAKLGVELVEQPFPQADDGALATLPRPIPVCADESAHDSTTLDHVIGKYDVINIKLDKTGGLTEALRTKRAAEDAGLKVMVGCMVGTSLAMAPGMLIAQGAAFVDLDAPLLLARDRTPGLRYDGSTVYPPDAALWG